MVRHTVKSAEHQNVIDVDALDLAVRLDHVSRADDCELAAAPRAPVR